MPNLLEQLRKYTVVVADTGDIDSMEKFRPQDATTNPSLIATAAQMPQYQPIVDGVLQEARKELGDGATDKDVANLAFQQLAVAFGKKILAIVPLMRACLTIPMPRCRRPGQSLSSMTRRELVGPAFWSRSLPRGRASRLQRFWREKGFTVT
jgi:hypothetical protein